MRGGSKKTKAWGAGIEAEQIIMAQYKRDIRAFKRISWAHHPEVVRHLGRIQSRKQYWKNPEANLEKSRNWRKRNPIRTRELQQKWRNSDAYEKWKNKPEIRIAHRLRRRAQDLLKSQSMSKSKIVGCTPTMLRQHIEAQFTKRMNWSNYGTYWHIDHIIPCSAFDLTNKEEAKICFNWQNLRPLPAKKNWQKHNKITDAQSSLPLTLIDSEGAA